MKGKVIIVSGPSGAGKGTIINSILSKHKDISFSTSYTTRKPRQGETHGIHYHFIDKNSFEELISKNDMLEWNKYADNYYGTRKSDVENIINSGKSIIIEVDVNGFNNLKSKLNNIISIFICPPSLAILRERLINRGTEEKDVIEKRLKRAEEEINYVHLYKHTITNNNLKDSIDEFESILSKN
ncbi:guanylate kinase [Bacilli bacterium]|nr:guanylate kinase [Bacilli bacterium]